MAGIVWQPNSSQWRLIWVLVTVVVLFWPGQQSHSLAIKALNWVADPMDKLPRMPANFSMDDGEDTEVVAAHDAQEAEYERAYSSSKIERLRLQSGTWRNHLTPRRNNKF